MDDAGNRTRTLRLRIALEVTHADLTTKYPIAFGSSQTMAYRLSLSELFRKKPISERDVLLLL